MSLFDRLKAILEAPPIVAMTHSDKITKEILELFRKHKASKVLPLLPKVPADARQAAMLPQIKVELTCRSCCKDFWAGVSKKKLLESITHAEKSQCEECANKEAEILASERTERQRLQPQIDDQRRVVRTESFIANYLNPNKCWNEGKNWEHMQSLNGGIAFTDEEKIVRHIKAMPYSEFLQTPYWVCIANEVNKRQKFRCALCSGSGPMHAHHNTYANHGRELDFWRTDIICLCGNCHQTFHTETAVAS